MQYRYHCKSIILALILCGLSAPTRGQTQVVWPRPPAEARIALEDILTGPRAFIEKPGFWKRLREMFQQSELRDIVRPMGIDAERGYLAVADPGAGGVHLFNRRQKEYYFLKPKNESGMPTPIDVAIGEREIYVLCPVTQTVQVFSFEGDFRHSISLKGIIRRPTSISYRDSRLYITDTPQHHIVCINRGGDILLRFGLRGTESGELNFPTFITTSPDGSIYISDTMNFRVQKYSRGGHWTQTFGSQGVMSGQFNRPKGVAIDDDRNVYVIDNSFDNVQIFNSEGQFLLHFGKTGHRPGQLMMPTDIAIDGDLIFVSDTMNRRIQIFRKL